MWGSAKRQQQQQDEAMIDVSTETLEHFERVRQTERDLGELKRRFAELLRDRELEREGFVARITDMERRYLFVQQQLLEAEEKRDRYHTRAIEAENVLRTVTSMLADAVERQAAAESMEEQPPPRAGDIGVDLNAGLAEAVANLPAVVRRGPAGGDQQ